MRSRIAMPTARGLVCVVHTRTAFNLNLLAVLRRDDWSDHDRNPHRRTATVLPLSIGCIEVIGDGSYIEVLVRDDRNELLRPPSLPHVEVQTGSGT